MQYIQPQHHARLAQAELLVIDEAAAIPLPLVRAMLGPYLVFLCSTVNGYEGALLLFPRHVFPCRSQQWCSSSAPILCTDMQRQNSPVAGQHVRASTAANVGLLTKAPGSMACPVVVVIGALTKCPTLHAGTGRSLSLKLISQLRDEGAKLAGGKKAASAAPSEGGALLARTFREVQLQEPIR